MIYQMEKLPQSQWESYISWAEDFEYEKLGLPRPQRVILLDMPLDAAQKLLSKRYGGRNEKKDLHERDLRYLENCAGCARFAAEKLGWRIVECARGSEPLSIEEIHRRVVSALD